MSKTLLPIASPSLILFDWDNTLIDSIPIIVRAINACFKHYNMPEWSLEYTKKNITLALTDYFPDLFGEEWQNARDLYYKNYLKYHLQELKPLENCENFLKILHARNMAMGVISNKRGDILRDEVSKLEWQKYFIKTIGAGDADNNKPHKAPYDLFLKDKPANISTEQTWFVGDSLADIFFAHNIGACPLIISASFEEIKTNKKYYLFNNINCLIDYI